MDYAQLPGIKQLSTLYAQHLLDFHLLCEQVLEEISQTNKKARDIAWPLRFSVLFIVHLVLLIRALPHKELLVYGLEHVAWRKYWKYAFLLFFQ